ncbi:hypothetical protein C8Q73DRAFT_415235 [Cubamyces lactineus]|nr:hypothetical protein C8Q73DRAFT_415235 [Cubamyces lactineus]
MSPSHPRPGKEAVNEEAASIILAYPDINCFSWDPPLFNLTPAPRRDALTLLSYCKPHKPLTNRRIATHSRTVVATVVDRYTAPTPLPQLPSSVVVEFREHINPSGNNPMMKVRIDGQPAERLLKIFSSARRQGPDEQTDPKLRFEAEREAYAHLEHYGGSAAAVVPRCFGWFELCGSSVWLPRHDQAYSRARLRLR